MKYRTIDVQSAIGRVRSLNGRFTLEQVFDCLDPKLNRGIDQPSKVQKAEITSALDSLISQGDVSSHQRGRGEPYIFMDERYVKELKSESARLLASVTAKIDEHRARLFDEDQFAEIDPETLRERTSYAMEAVSFFTRMVPKDFPKFPPFAQVFILRLVDTLIVSQNVAEEVPPPRRIAELRGTFQQGHAQIGHVDRIVATLSESQGHPRKDIEKIVERLCRDVLDPPSLPQ